MKKNPGKQSNKTNKTIQLYHRLTEALIKEAPKPTFKVKKGVQKKSDIPWTANPTAEAYFKKWARVKYQSTVTKHRYEFEVFLVKDPAYNFLIQGGFLGPTGTPAQGLVQPSIAYARANMQKQDRVWVNDDGEFWSTNTGSSFGYRYNKQKDYLELLNKPNGTTVLGIIKFTKSGLAGFTPKVDSNVVKLTKAELERQKFDATTEGLDWIQTAADWVGLVPFIGDIVDIFNALGYYARIKLRGETDLWIDFILSLVALLPVAGSVIKLTIKKTLGKLSKKILKVLEEKGIRAASDIHDFEKQREFWSYLEKEGVLTTGVLDKFGSGLELAGEIAQTGARRFKNSAVPMPKSLRERAYKELDEFANWCDQANKAIDDVVAAAGRGTSKPGFFNPTFKAAPDAVKKAADAALGASEKILARGGRLGRLATKTLNAVSNFAISASWFPTSKLKALKEAMTRRFKREMIRDTGKLAYILHLMPGRAMVLKSIFDTISKNPVLLAQLKKFPKFLNKSNIEIRDLAKLSVTEMQQLLSQLYFVANQNGLDKIYGQIATTIAEEAIAKGHIVYEFYLQNTVNNMYTLFSKDMLPNGWKFWKDLDLSLRNNLDLIWNELRDWHHQWDVPNPGEIIYPIYNFAKVRSSPKRTTTNTIRSVKKGIEVGTMIAAVTGEEAPDGTNMWYKIKDTSTGKIGYVRGDMAAGADKIDGVIYPLIQKIVSIEVLGGVEDSGKKLNSMLKQYVGKNYEAARNVINSAAELAGVSDHEAYDPTEEAGGKYE